MINSLIDDNSSNPVDKLADGKGKGRHMAAFTIYLFMEKIGRE